MDAVQLGNMGLGRLNDWRADRGAFAALTTNREHEGFEMYEVYMNIPLTFFSVCSLI